MIRRHVRLVCRVQKENLAVIVFSVLNILMRKLICLQSFLIDV